LRFLRGRSALRRTHRSENPKIIAMVAMNPGAHFQASLECWMPIVMALSILRNSTRQLKLCGNSTVMAMAESRLMNCAHPRVDNVDLMAIRVGRGVMDLVRVCPASGSTDLFPNAVSVPRGSRSGPHGCAMIAPPQVLAQWLRVSMKCVLSVGRQWSSVNSLLNLLNLPNRPAPDKSCALLNRRYLHEWILRENAFNNRHHDLCVRGRSAAVSSGLVLLSVNGRRLSAPVALRTAIGHRVGGAKLNLRAETSVRRRRHFHHNRRHHRSPIREAVLLRERHRREHCDSVCAPHRNCLARDISSSTLMACRCSYRVRS